jgi:hypothetical protein|tara:strand:- start:1233 stop:1442 length:210 start_codon:yes stop_codon:yes gene_type:complete
MTYRPIVDRLHRWQPRKPEKNLTPDQVSRIVSMLIQEAPNLDSLYLIRDGLSSYLSIFDEIGRDRDNEE